MKVLLTVFMGLLLVGCGKKEKTSPEKTGDQTQKADTKKKGQVACSFCGKNFPIRNLAFHKSKCSENKTDMLMTKPVSGKLKAETEEAKNIIPVVAITINNPIVEKAIRLLLEKPTGKFAKEDLEKVTNLALNSNKLTNVKDLEKLGQLEVLYLQNNQLNSVKGLENLTQLTYLVLNNNQLANVKGLGNLTQMTLLHLNTNKLISVKDLVKLTKLKELYLYGNQLTSVKGLEKLGQLEVLNLGDNQLTDVKGLENLTQLRELRLSNNRLTDVTGLEKLTQLGGVNLMNNPDLTMAQIDELQKALPKCKIFHNAKK